ncbi:MAG: hypothetical protein HUU49_00260 [Candidatus Buchananbacteria bacterium]|nr:hypothetical protein [Candidatus Buchananbacteria bacterium]
MDQLNAEKFKGKGALDAFLNLFSLITLGWMAIAIGMILFQIIDKFLSPGAVGYLSVYSQSSLKFGVASALIVTPIFLLIVNLLHQNYRKGTLNHDSGVYRWLTYLILLVTALNIIGRLIQLVFQLLDGDYTLASILKIVVVLLIASGIFGYYWYDLKRHDYSSRSMMSQIFFGVIVAVALASIIGSFFIIDSPNTARMKKYDQQRVNDLSGLDNLINVYYNENKKVPADLSEPRFGQFADPATSEPYGYRAIDQTTYELCADFDLAVEDERNTESYYYGYGDKNWYYHDAGRQCFTSQVYDPEVKPLPVR